MAEIEVPIPQSLGRWRGACGINWNGMAIVGDAFSNVLGRSDFAVSTEYGETIPFVVVTPPIHDDRKRVFVQRWEIEVESGQGLPDSGTPVLFLDYSKDGGITWWSLRQSQSMGRVGQYIKRLRWLNVGQARTWIFRLRVTDPVRRMIIGTFIDRYTGLG